MPSEEKDGDKKEKVSLTLWVDREVSIELEKASKAIDRSRSWMGNMLFRKSFGLPIIGGGV